jgi:site-specific DNA recombinase
MSDKNGKPMQLIPAVGYLRRSSDSETQQKSIPEQKDAVQAYADDKGYRIVRWYIDDAVSGDDTDHRHDFQRMIRDAKDLRDFKAILCWDQKRFGRFDSIEYGFYVFPLRKADVYLATVVDGTVDWNDVSGRIIANVKQEGAHQQLLDHSANVARGRLGSAKSGSWFGSPPYAYRIEGPKHCKRLVVDDEGKKRVVQRIFHEFVEEGRPMKNIADRLNDEGFVSPGGRVKGWRFDTVKVILENPAYTGDYAGCRFSFGKYHTVHKEKVVKGGRRCKRPETDWVVHRDHHEAMIDRATFERAQAILSRGKTGRSPYTPEENPYILSGLLRCGRCKCGLKGMTNGTYRYYECSNRAYNGPDACDGTNVREDRILHSIANHLDRDFLSLDGKALASKARHEELTAEDLPKAFAKVKQLVCPPEQLATDRNRMEKRAKTLTEQMAKARRNLILLDPENIPAAQDAIRQLERELGELEGELRKKPPSEQDVNAEVKAVLRSLYWLALLFHVAAEQEEEATLKEEERAMRVRASYAFENPAVALRPFLGRITEIVVHTDLAGRGTRRRHTFERGEIAFSVGLDTGNLNSHRAD